MKALTAIIALSLGIGATPVEAKECKFVIGGNTYTIQEIVDKAQKGVAFYADRDKALVSSGITLPKTGRIFPSEEIPKVETDKKLDSASDFKYLLMDTLYDPLKPWKGPLKIKATLANFAHKLAPGAPIVYIFRSPNGTYSSPHCK